MNRWSQEAATASETKTRSFYQTTYNCNSYAEYEQRRLAEILGGAAPAAHTMQRPQQQQQQPMQEDLEAGKMKAEGAAVGGSTVSQNVSQNIPQATAVPGTQGGRDAHMALPVVYAYPA
jgi:predicted ATPase